VPYTSAQGFFIGQGERGAGGVPADYILISMLSPQSRNPIITDIISNKRTIISIFLYRALILGRTNDNIIKKVKKIQLNTVWFGMLKTGHINMQPVIAPAAMSRFENILSFIFININYVYKLQLFRSLGGV
jgi:hypothetical protein